MKNRPLNSVRSGPLYPPPPESITEELFSCETAAKMAYDEAQLTVEDINFFALYDCFPICFLRALEAVHICAPGKAGDWIEEKYNEYPYIFSWGLGGR